MLFAIRILDEEKALTDELSGYREYTAKCTPGWCRTCGEGAEKHQNEERT